MELIVKIPDEAYELLKSKPALDNIAESIIANGTPYNPSGDLISRSALKASMRKAEEQADTFEMLVEFYEQIIDNAQAVEPICPYLSDNEIKQPCLNSPCERPQGECCGSCYLCDVGCCGAEMRTKENSNG